MKQFGTVKAHRPGNLALVSLSAADSCSSCGSRNVCRGLSLAGNRKCPEILVSNDLGAEVGDTVELELKPAAAMAAITSTFLLPVLGIVAGYTVGAPGGLAPGAVGAGAGLVIGVGLSILVNRSLARKPGFQLGMTRIVGGAPGGSGSGADGDELRGDTAASAPGGEL